MTDQRHAFSDEDLTAYLDGEAAQELRAQIDAQLDVDPALGERLAKLDATGVKLRTAFDLDAISAPQMPPMQQPQHPRRPLFLMPAAIAASFALGVIVTTALQPKDTWVDQVASYQALYVPETLSGGTQAAAATERTLTSARAGLGLAMQKVPQFEGMQFKRAQMLSVNGNPLIQIAYLADDGTPFALCITRASGDDRGMVSETNHSLAAAHWVSNGLGYVLIGGENADRVAALAETLPNQL